MRSVDDCVVDMTSKIRQSCTSILACIAIILLLSFIVVVWMFYGSGNGRRKGVEGGGGNFSTVYSETTARWHQIRQLEKDEVERRHTTGKKLLEINHLDDLGPADVEYVKPMKINPQELHEHDIIFDQMRNVSTQPPLRHHSGHFRHKMAEIWDPYPTYEFVAFGRKLRLELGHNRKFIAPELHVTHFWDNYTQKVKHDPRMAGCFYRGTVKGDHDSDISVSLCGGMTGYIRTSEDNYYIHPVERYQDQVLNGTILHIIKKVPHKTETMSNDVVEESFSGADSCETKDTGTIVNDDFSVYQRRRTKREIVYDDFNEISTEKLESYSRPARDLSWFQRSSTEDTSKRKRSDSNEYYVEILIVVDKHMLEYHRTSDNVIHYILTLMSHVDLLFKDASIGNAISLAVVHIWILKDKEFGGSRSDEMLKKFCQWQQMYTTKYPHDTALLLTREMICRDEALEECNTIGVADLGSMCNPNAGCSIVRDKGLSTSYTIAHELGHVLSMPHDEDKRCDKYFGGVKETNLMSYTLRNGKKPWSWSKCSKHYLTEFLDSSHAECLLNLPDNNFLPMRSKRLPGEMFQADKQCELEFGEGWTLCTLDGYLPCRELWCKNPKDGTCVTWSTYWADGTPCGDRLWCHDGECIPSDRHMLIPIPGGWGPWQSWGPCTRTCGGGIRSSKRYCDSPPPANGGPFCTGSKIRYESCNTQPCLPDAVDYREIQCAEFNGDSKGLQGLPSDVQWVPKYGISNYPEDLCKLYCRVAQSSAPYQLKEKVTDGTKCGLYSFDICVNGICRPGGCDNKLDSNKTLDECGVCGGDNSQCEQIMGTYNISKEKGRYSRVVLIPKGSLNIVIKQRGHSKESNDENYLALVDGETGEYILNGKHKISTYAKDVFYGGLTIKYSGSEKTTETVTTAKNRKLTKDLILEVLSVDSARPPDITYRYVINKSQAPRYAWRLYEKTWTECNSICSGTQYMKPSCVELAINALVDDERCSDLDMSGVMQQRECNTHCQLVWNVMSRGHCSAHCGTGLRNVFYNCVKVDLTKPRLLQFPASMGSHGEVVEDEHCGVLPKPAGVEECQGSCDATRWEYSDWSDCSKTCGGGMQTRSASCVNEDNDKLSDNECDEGKKVTEQLCNVQKCPIWSFGDWTPCSVTCGKGYRTRPYFCHVDGRIGNPQDCNPHELASIKEECYEEPCVRWFTGYWSKCSVSCGRGVETREVACRTFDSVPVKEHRCNAALKPNSTRECTMEECMGVASSYYNRYHYDNNFADNTVEISPSIRFSWTSGQWTPCSKSCGGGIRQRAVVCRNELGEESHHYCNHLTKPNNTLECNTHTCPTWSYGAWTKCDSLCQKHRLVTCVNARGVVINETQCSFNEKPSATERCLQEECLTRHYNADTFKVDNERRYKWKMGKWSQCSKSCGKGVKTRQVSCKDTIHDITLVDQYCSHLRKPKNTRTCERNNCAYTWVEGEWSKCSQSCDEGVKYRNVTCHKVHHSGFVDPQPTPYSSNHRHYCDLFSKPVVVAKCIDRNCADMFSWEPGPWKECSHTCGRKGRQIRKLYCISREGNKVPRYLCPKEFRPPRKRKCNQHKCLYKSCKEIKYNLKTNQNKDYTMSVHGKPALVYCYKMDTPEPEEYISLQANTENYAEIYDRRLRNMDSCPYSGQRRDNCDCVQIGGERSGLTNFYKVRLNVTSLRIIGDVFTFSTQTIGKKKIPFGTAGDCYSQKRGCPQGRFSVDLSGTSFKIVSGVRWRPQGYLATAQINIGEKRVTGKCGGYCGECIPDSSLGLAVEVT